MKIALRFCIGVLFVASACSCKKSVDKLKEEYVLGVLTSGLWFLDNYTLNDNDLTYIFSGYDFKFYDGGKMEAIKGTTVSPGTWSGNTTKLTFTVNLPGPDPAFSRLNYEWNWIKSNVGVVFAENISLTQKITIRLKKK